MTRELLTTAQFRKDLKKAGKRGRDRSKIEDVIGKIMASEPLAPRHRPHRLSGKWHECRECHIEPDWLLIWSETETSVTLIRTGTHADLFD